MMLLKFKYLNIFFAVSVTFSFFYFIIKGRLFRDILNIPFQDIAVYNKSFWFIVSALIFTSIFVIIFTYICYRYVKPKEITEKKLNIFQKIFNFFVLVIKKFIDSVLNLFVICYTTIFDALGEDRNVYVFYFARYFLTLHKYHKIIIYLGDVFPRVFISLVFIIEIYLQHLHYYFISLMLLIIPLIFRFIIFILKDIGPRLKPVFESYFIIYESKTTIPYEGKMQNVTILEMELKPEYENINRDFFINRYYEPIIKIESFMNNTFIPKRTKISLFTTYIYHIIHLIGWSYILYTVLY